MGDVLSREFVGGGDGGGVFLMLDLASHIASLFAQHAPSAWEVLCLDTNVVACARCGAATVARVRGRVRVRCSVACNEGRVRPGSLRQLAIKHGVSYTTVKSRIACGWTLERAVGTRARRKVRP